MVRWSITLLALLCITCPSCRPRESPVSPPEPRHGTAAPVPALPFSESEYNFGTIIQGDAVSYTFQLENNKEEATVLTRVADPCGCVQGVFPKEPVPAHGTGDIAVALDASQRLGPQMIALDVHTSGSERTVAQLRLVGFVIPIMRIEPPVVQMLDIPRNKPATCSVTITHVRNEPWSVKSVDVPMPLLSVAVPDGQQNVSSHELVLSFTPDKPGRKHGTFLTIHTNLQKHPLVQVPVMCSVAPAIKLYPRDISFGRMMQGETKTKKVLMRSTEGLHFSIESARASTTHVSVSFDKDAVVTDQRLSVTFTPPANAGKLTGMLVVKTSIPEATETQVPMYADIIKDRRHTAGSAEPRSAQVTQESPS